MPHLGVLNTKSVLWNFIIVKGHFWHLNAIIWHIKCRRLVYEMDPVPLEALYLFKYELLLRQKRNVTYDRLISLMARKQNIWMKKKTFEWKRKLIPAPVCSANVYFQNSVLRADAKSTPTYFLGPTFIVNKL